MELFLILLIIFLISAILSIFSYLRTESNIPKISKIKKDLKKDRVVFQASSSK